VLDTAVPNGSPRPARGPGRDELPRRARAGELGTRASDLDGLVVTLRESQIAWASYERRL
jgi:hypothetical protein